MQMRSSRSVIGFWRNNSNRMLSGLRLGSIFLLRNKTLTFLCYDRNQREEINNTEVVHVSDISGGR